MSFTQYMLGVVGMCFVAVYFGATNQSVTPPRRVHNFSAGPGPLPLQVLQEMQRDLVDYQGKGASIIEMSHRDVDGPVQQVMIDAVAATRELLDVPDTHTVLHMHGGAHAQFAAIPMNLQGNHTFAQYITTGFWSERARVEGSRQMEARKVSGVQLGGSDKLMGLKPVSEWGIDNDAAYVHICASETIDGLEFFQDPVLPVGAPPLVADFTSTLFSRPLNVSAYGVIYASSGKNLGPSGVTLVIVRNDLLHRVSPHTPSFLSYATQADTEPIPSLYNTPATFPLYAHSLMLKHYIANGGILANQARAIRRADSIFAIVDSSDGFYFNAVQPSQRSRMNVPITIGGFIGLPQQRRDLEQEFVQQAEAQGLQQLFGHKVRGGLRVTLYLGVSDSSVEAVIAFLQRFEQDNRHRLRE